MKDLYQHLPTEAYVTGGSLAGELLHLIFATNTACVKKWTAQANISPFQKQPQPKTDFTPKSHCLLLILSGILVSVQKCKAILNPDIVSPGHCRK